MSANSRIQMPPVSELGAPLRLAPPPLRCRRGLLLLLLPGTDARRPAAEAADADLVAALRSRAVRLPLGPCAASSSASADLYTPMEGGGSFFSWNLVTNASAMACVFVVSRGGAAGAASVMPVAAAVLARPRLTTWRGTV